jgi:pyruvate,orthophosphate dikinase
MPKRVYFFGAGKAEGQGHQKELLGGKGAGLAEMTNIGLPVPGGFTITIDTCAEYYTLGQKFPKGLEQEVRQHVAKLEKAAGKKLGDPNDPLLVSVRSGAARSMPGMMETILNLGLNDISVEGLANKTQNPRFAYDSYRRFIQMYATTAMGLSKEPMEEMLHHLKEKLGVKNDTDVGAEPMKELCREFKAFYKSKKGEEFPQDPYVQLWGAIKAVFDCWEADKAVTYRRVEKLNNLKGTAVNIVQMVYGNKGDRSGTGVCFTRDPNTGENVFYGDLLINAQGEDVVAGIRTPLKLAELEKVLPAANQQLYKVRSILESHYKDMQDLEFTIEDEKLYMLQCRTGKRSPAATFVMAADMVKEKLITKEVAISRIMAEDIERLFYPVIDPKVNKTELQKRQIATGINAVPGAASGEVVFNAADAEELAKAGRPVILVRKETSPEDVGGMHAAVGILTATGGKTSHAAVVARGWGKCCVVGCEMLQIDYENQRFTAGNTVVKKGEFITLNGSEGLVYTGKMDLVKPVLPDAYYTIMKYADQIRTMKVRTNADTPYDAENAIKMGAEGIGLCRTEHMFFDTEERRQAIQEMIVADTESARRAALAKLLPFQRDDFYGIFKAMNGLPVTIRLVDPPLHEFVPHEEPKQRALAEIIGVPFEKIKQRVDQLHESNPMLGHRGCRLCITYPEILEMQVQAIIEAAVKCKQEKIKVLPEIMHPLVLDLKEFQILEARTRKVAADVMDKAGVKVEYLVGTMIEVPRAALLADEIAKSAEFFSFGTNDLTQTTMALSRDDAGRFLPDYVDVKKAGVFADDPFQSLDQAGVGKLVKMGIQLGRATRPNIKIGICGEHGGELKSVKFCHNVGMNYVSCSPYRVPIARLAAAQAAIETANARKGSKVKAAKPKSAPKKAMKSSKAAKPARNLAKLKLRKAVRR